MSDSATSVAHEHVAVDKSAGKRVSVPIVLQEPAMNSLVDIVVLPVSFGRIVPPAGGGQGIHDDPFVEAGC